MSTEILEIHFMHECQISIDFCFLRHIIIEFQHQPITCFSQPSFANRNFNSSQSGISLEGSIRGSLLQSIQPLQPSTLRLLQHYRGYHRFLHHNVLFWESQDIPPTSQQYGPPNGQFKRLAHPRQSVQSNEASPGRTKRLEYSAFLRTSTD